MLSLATTAALAVGVQANETDWDSSFDLGATITRGNSDSTLLTLGFATSKKEAQDEYFANLSYTYGESEEATTSDEVLGSAAWNRLYTDASYAGLRFDVRSDKLADIDYRAGLTALLGHYFVKSASTSFALEAGIGYTFEQVGGISDSYANAYIGDRFEHKFNDKTRVYQTLGATAPLEDLEDYSLVAEVGVETFLSDSLALKIYVQDKYEAQPTAGLDKNDLKFVTGISYKF